MAELSPLDKRALFQMGYYSRTIMPAVEVLLGEWGGIESHTEILRGVAPLKSASKRLLPAEDAHRVIESLNTVYDLFKDLRFGNYSSSQDRQAKYEKIEDEMAEVASVITEFGASELKEGDFMLFKSGQMVGDWDFDIESNPISAGSLAKLVGFLKSVGAVSAGSFAKQLNKRFEAEPLAASNGVHRIFSMVLDHIDADMVASVQSSGDESQSALTGLPDLAQFENDAGLFLDDPLTPVSVAFVDIDNFKQLNTDIGHDTADEVIKELGDVLSAMSGGRAKVYHRSGDEFLVHMPNTGPAEAQIYMSRLVGRVASNIFATSKGDQSITISSGISSYPEHGDSVADLTDKANIAMGESKRSGKSQSTVWQDTTDKGDSQTAV